MTSTEQELYDKLASGTWGTVRNSLVGKELISWGGAVVDQATEDIEKIRNSFDYRTASKRELIICANFWGIPISFVRPSILKVPGIGDGVINVSGQATIAREGYAYSYTCPQVVSKFDNEYYQGSVTSSNENTTISVGERESKTGVIVSGSFPEGIIRVFRKSETNTNVDTNEELVYNIINMYDGSMFIYADDNSQLDVHYIKATTNSEDIPKEDVSKGYTFVQGEEGEEVARAYLMRGVKRLCAISTVSDIREYVNSFKYIIDSAVEVTDSVTVYTKSSNKDNVSNEVIRSQLETYGVQGVSYKIAEGTEYHFSIKLSGSYANTLTVKQWLSDKLSRDNLSYNWAPDLYVIEGMIREHFGNVEGLEVAIEVESNVGLDIIPVEGSVKVMKNKKVMGYERNGVLYGYTERTLEPAESTALTRTKVGEWIVVSNQIYGTFGWWHDQIKSCMKITQDSVKLQRFSKLCNGANLCNASGINDESWDKALQTKLVPSLLEYNASGSEKPYYNGTKTYEPADFWTEEFGEYTLAVDSLFNAFLYRTNQIDSVAEPIKQGTVPHTWTGLRAAEATWGGDEQYVGRIGSATKWWRPNTRSRVHPLEYKGGILFAVVYDDENQQGKVVSTSFAGDEKVVDTINEKFNIRAVVRDDNAGFIVIHEYMGSLKASLLDTTTFMYLGTYEVATNFKKPDGFRFVGSSPQGLVLVASTKTTEGDAESVYLCKITMSDKVYLTSETKPLYTYNLLSKDQRIRFLDDAPITGDVDGEVYQYPLWEDRRYASMFGPYGGCSIIPTVEGIVVSKNTPVSEKVQVTRPDGSVDTESSVTQGDITLVKYTGEVINLGNPRTVIDVSESAQVGFIDKETGKLTVYDNTYTISMQTNSVKKSVKGYFVLDEVYEG